MVPGTILNPYTHIGVEQEIRQLRAQTATVQTRLFQQRYSEAQPQLTATVEGLQQVVFSLSAQVAANTYTRSHMPPESAIDQFRHGAKLREMTLGAVRRSDTDAEIDLFELACIGKKTGTLRLAEYACTFAVGQFVFLRATDKRLRLAQVTSVTQPRAWGEICAHPVLATNWWPWRVYIRLRTRDQHVHTTLVFGL